jgi:hypothetical protein
MMQIQVNPASLTQEQREAVAGFILAYPVDKNPRSLDLELNIDTAKAQKQIADLEATTAFGAPAIPLAPGATSAPSIANANPLPTAPEEAKGITFPVAPIVPSPPALTDVTTEFAALLNPASGVELDKSGMPWDARIHSESKSKLADGSWRKKRGLDPAVLAVIEAELKQVMSAPVAPAPVAPAPVAPAPVAPAPVAPAPVAPAPAPAPAPVAPSVDPKANFIALIGRASAAIHGNKITQAEITQICAEFGVPALPLLANRIDLVDQVAARVDALIATR